MNNLFKKKNFFAKYLGAILSIATIILVLIIGILIGRQMELSKFGVKKVGVVINKEAKPSFEIKQNLDFATFWKVWEKIRQEYAHQPIDESKLFYGALKGLVAGLEDPYSVFLVPEIATEFQEELDGKFEGIGAEIGIRDEVLVIVSPLNDSPAERAGLKASDKILAIDGISTEGISIDEAVKKIRGERGTEVKLTIFREGFSEPKDIFIIRDKIIIKSVQWEMIGNIAKIKMSQFGTETRKEFDKIVREIILKNPDGIILDLRNNPGGFLDSAITIAGEWVPKDIVVYERYKSQDTGLYANGKGRLQDFKTVVLINKGSASASEIVSGALKDYEKANIVGEQSFGKGSVQDLEEYGDGSALKLTIALWLTPKGVSIDGQGIIPDVEVKMTEEDYKEGRDPQLDKAIEILKNN